MGLIYERDEKANVPPPPKTGKEGETSHNGDSAFRWRIRIMSGSLQNAPLCWIRDISPGDVGLWVDLPTQFQFLPTQARALLDALQVSAAFGNRPLLCGGKEFN